MREAMSEPAELVIALPDEAATRELGARLAALVRAGDFIALSGDLGAGAHGLTEDVPSPTFTIVQTYETPDLLITHADLYRIDRPQDVAELGLGEALEDGMVLVEWPERMEAQPRDRLDIGLFLVKEGTNAREARLRGFGSWTSRLEKLKAA